MDELVKVLKSIADGEELICGIKNGDRSVIARAVVTLLSLDNRFPLGSLIQKIEVLIFISA